MLGERLLVEKFVEKKVGLFVRVTREEAEAYFNEHAAEYPGQRFQDVQKSIVALLMDRKVGQQLDQYVADLRSKADIRVNQLEKHRLRPIKHASAKSKARFSQSRNMPKFSRFRFSDLRT